MWLLNLQQENSRKFWIYKHMCLVITVYQFLLFWSRATDLFRSFQFSLHCFSLLPYSPYLQKFLFFSEIRGILNFFTWHLKCRFLERRTLKQSYYILVYFILFFIYEKRLFNFTPKNKYDTSDFVTKKLKFFLQQNFVFCSFIFYIFLLPFPNWNKQVQFMKSNTCVCF